MKRILFSASALLLAVLLLCTPVSAASGTYDLDELGLQLTVPSGYSVITKDTPSDDPIFAALGTTKSALMDHFAASNICLNAISNSYSDEIVVTMTEVSMGDLGLLSNTVLESIIPALVDQLTSYGFSISKYDIYEHAQTKFIRLYFSDSAETVHGLQYLTMYDGKSVTFTMRSYEGSLSSTQETTIKTIVDSITFDKTPLTADSGEETDPFVYTDGDSGVSFTVPANWEIEPFSQEREFIDVKFASTKEDGCTIIYGSSDAWEQLSAAEKAMLPRSELNNDFFTEADIAEIYGISEDKVSTVTYNGIQYFKAEMSASADAYGIDLSFTMIQLVYVDNGWMYTFQFSGTHNHKLYPDFERLLESVEYPSASGGSVPTGKAPGKNTPHEKDSSKTPASQTANAGVSSAGIIAAVVLPLIVAAIVIIIVIFRKKKSKAASASPAPYAAGASGQTIICRNCGHSLPADSVFCYVCGSKTE